MAETRIFVKNKHQPKELLSTEKNAEIDVTNFKKCIVGDSVKENTPYNSNRTSTFQPFRRKKILFTHPALIAGLPLAFVEIYLDSFVSKLSRNRKTVGVYMSWSNIMRQYKGLQDFH